MTKKKTPEPEAAQPKRELKKDGILYIFSCRCCKAVHLSDLTYLEHELRFHDLQRSLRPPTMGCPICGTSMDQVNNFPSSAISTEQTTNALRLIEVAARAINLIREIQP